jgi:hypothetical protein
MGDVTQWNNSPLILLGRMYDGNTDGSGIYFVKGHNTRFGSGFAMWQQKVKNFFLDNGRMYLARLVGRRPAIRRRPFYPAGRD